jgi:hypothetical protein
LTLYSESSLTGRAMINFGKEALALARDSVHDRSGYEAYALTGILMRRSARTTFGRIGCAGVVVGAGLRPVGDAGLREVDSRYLRGSSQVDRGHEPCWQIAARMARHVMRRAQVARGVLAPLPSSRESGLAADSGGTVAGPSGPVLPSYWSRARPGIFGGGVKDGRADRIFKVGQYPAHVRPGNTAIGCGRPAAQRRARPGP